MINTVFLFSKVGSDIVYQTHLMNSVYNSILSLITHNIDRVSQVSLNVNNKSYNISLISSFAEYIKQL